MRNKKILITSTLLSILCIACIFNAFAHSGRTDSSGGHWDRSTGTYHYHSGPKDTTSSSSKTADDIIKEFNSIGNTSSSSSSSSASLDDILKKYNSTSIYDKGYKAGHTKGYNVGYDYGYDRGYEVGYEEGYDKQSVILIIILLISIILIIFVEFVKHRRSESLKDNLETAKSVNKKLEEELEDTRNNHQYYQFTLFERSDADET